MVFKQVPSRVLSGNDAGRLEPLYDEAKLLFDQIRADQRIVVTETPTP